MTSERKCRANRANARFATGPRTAAGKARAANNALRHGLSRAVLDDRGLAEEAEVFSRRIAGADPDREVLARAREVAEAQVDLKRVRLCRHRVLERALGASDERPRGDSEAVTSVRAPGAAGIGTAEPMRELIAIDRYERRALSRRKFAIRALDQARLAARNLAQAAAET